MADDLVVATRSGRSSAAWSRPTTSTSPIPRGVDRRAHRPERRRQDDVLQPAHRRLQADLGLDPLRRRPRSPAAAVRDHELGIARTFQNIRLFHQMSALENVLVGMHCRLHAAILGSILRTPRVKARGGRGTRTARASSSSLLRARRAATRRSARNLPTATSAGSRSPARSRRSRSSSCWTSRLRA